MLRTPRGLRQGECSADVTVTCSVKCLVLGLSAWIQGPRLDDVGDRETWLNPYHNYDKTCNQMGGIMSTIPVNQRSLAYLPTIIVVVYRPISRKVNYISDI